MFADFRAAHDLFAHVQQLSLAVPRGLDPNTAANDIMSPVTGNFEASMGKSPASLKEFVQGAAGGNSDYRGISSDVVSSAYENVIDFTGKVNADGTPVSHGMYEDTRMSCPHGIGCSAK